MSSQRCCVPLQDQAALDLVRSKLDRAVEQRLVGNHAPRLEATGRRYDDVGLGVVDARRQFPRGKAAEHDGMHRAKPRAGQHREDRLGHHRHIDDDAVAFAHALVLQHRSQRHHLLLDLRIGELLLRPGDRAVVDQRDLVGAAAGDMPVHAVVAGVAFRADEPAAIDAGLGVEHRVPGLGPVDRLRRFGPERVRVAFPAFVDGVIARTHRNPP